MSTLRHQTSPLSECPSKPSVIVIRRMEIEWKFIDVDGLEPPTLEIYLKKGGPCITFNLHKAPTCHPYSLNSLPLKSN